LQAFAAIEQEPGERVDGDAARENFAHDLAIAFRLAVAEFSLALRLLALSFFLLAPPFLGCLHLRGIIGGSAYHETSPFRPRANLPGAAASGADGFANGRKFFCLPFACYRGWRGAPPNRPCRYSAGLFGGRPMAGDPGDRVI
jgi:hypothetical protein